LDGREIRRFVGEWRTQSKFGRLYLSPNNDRSLSPHIIPNDLIFLKVLLEGGAGAYCLDPVRNMQCGENSEFLHELEHIVGGGNRGKAIGRVPSKIKDTNIWPM